MSNLFHTGLTVVTFVVVIVCIIRPIPIWKQWKLDMGTAPLLGVVLLLIVGVLQPVDVLHGLVGRPDSDLIPYAIMLLFLSLTWLGLAIDRTGAFAYIAWRVTARAARMGYSALMAQIYLLCGITSVLTSNDTVVLTVTPILCELAHSLNLDPVPLVIMEFLAANTWSIALYISNPTNIIVAQAAGMTALGYSRIMLPVAIVAALTTFTVARYIVFRKIVAQFGNTISTKQSEMVISALKDRNGAIAGSTLLSMSLVLLFVLSFYHVPVWMTTLPFACIMFVFDLIRDWQDSNQMGNESVILLDLNRNFDQEITVSVSVGVVQESRIQQIAKRMPWKIAPFLVGMFSLVEALTRVGLVSTLAELLADLCGKSILQTSIVVTLSSTLLCSLMNNQPMTILVSQMILDPVFQTRLTETQRNTALLSLALASNIGANMTPIGALAGLLWQEMLNHAQVSVSWRQFITICAAVTPITAVISAITIGLFMML